MGMRARRSAMRSFFILTAAIMKVDIATEGARVRAFGSAPVTRSISERFGMESTMAKATIALGSVTIISEDALLTANGMAKGPSVMEMAPDMKVSGAMEIWCSEWESMRATRRFFILRARRSGCAACQTGAMRATLVTVPVFLKLIAARRRRNAASTSHHHGTIRPVRLRGRISQTGGMRC